MKQHDLAITGGDVVIGDDVAKLNVGVRDGRISVISDQPIDAAETIDATGLTVMPGVIDEHYHCFGGYGWETYENSTRGAAKGGVTSVMPSVSSSGWSTSRRNEPGGMLSMRKRPSESVGPMRPVPSTWMSAPTSGSS